MCCCGLICVKLDEMTVGVIAPWLAFVPFGRRVWDLWSIWCMRLFQQQFQSHKIMVKRLLQPYSHERHWTTRCVPIPQLLSNGVKQMLDSKWKGNGCYEKIQQDFFKKKMRIQSRQQKCLERNHLQIIPDLALQTFRESGDWKYTRNAIWPSLCTKHVWPCMQVYTCFFSDIYSAGVFPSFHVAFI